MTERSETADDWQDAAEMIRAAGYVHSAEVIEEQAATIERLSDTLRGIRAMCADDPMIVDAVNEALS